MINLGVSLLVALFFVPSLIDKIGLKRRRKSSLTGVKRKWKIGEYPFLRMAAFEDAKGAGLFQSFLQVADTEALPLESSGLSVAVAGIRITGLSVAGKRWMGMANGQRFIIRHWGLLPIGKGETDSG